MGTHKLWGKDKGLIYLPHRIRNEHLPQMLGTKRAMGAYLCSAYAALLEESEAGSAGFFQVGLRIRCL